jgi:hypothetical protein
MAKKNKPVEITLRFKSDYAKSFFLGQLSDGWGENGCSLKWGRTELDRAKVVDVAVFSDWGDEPHEIVDEASDRQAQRMNRLLLTQVPRSRTRVPLFHL